MGDNITHGVEPVKSHSTPCCCTKTLKFLTPSLFCLLVTAHKVLCLLSSLEKSKMFVSTVALSNIFTPAKSISNWGFVFLAKNPRVFSPYPARIHLLDVI